MMGTPGLRERLCGLRHAGRREGVEQLGGVQVVVVAVHAVGAEVGGGVGGGGDALDDGVVDGVHFAPTWRQDGALR
jgi:hypothetical protein